MWRIDALHSGWERFFWLEHLHWAAPAAVGSFLVWLAVFCGVRSVARRLLFVLIATAGAAACLWAAGWSLYYYYLSGPMVLAEGMDIGETAYRVYYCGIFVVYPAIPVCACILSKLSGRRVRLAHLVLSAALFAAAVPTAMIVLDTVDSIDAVRSGLYMPSVVVGLGVPFMALKWKRRRRR